MSTAYLDLRSLLLDGREASGKFADVVEAMTALSMVETIEGASSVVMTLSDDRRNFLRSDLLQRRVKLVLDGAGFELAAVRKTGNALQLTFEDMAVAALRRQTKPRKADAGTMSRAEFCSLLIHEIPGIDVITTTGQKSSVELARGNTNPNFTQNPNTKPEDTWTAITRIMGEIQWRVFARRGDVYILPDDHLENRYRYRLGEDSRGVLSIDMDFDAGKPAATASVQMEVGAHDLLPGMGVDLSGMGPGDGAWILSEVRRTVESRIAKLSLLRQRPALPEPGNNGVDLGEQIYKEAWVLPPGKYGGTNLNAEQLKNAKTIYDVGKLSKATDRDILVSFMTSLQEAGLRNLTYGDRDSVGLFQQRPSQGWGARNEILNTSYSSRKFFEALLRIPNRTSHGLGQLAQMVQRSAFPYAYDKWEDEARAILDAIGRLRAASHKVSSGGSTPASVSLQVKKFVNAALSKQGRPYVWGASGPNSFDCSGMVQWSAAQAGKTFPKPVTSQYNLCRQAGTLMGVADAINTFGALLIRVNRGSFNHIAISLGNGKDMEAMGTAQGCLVANSTGRDWTHGALVPGWGY